MKQQLEVRTAVRQTMTCSPQQIAFVETLALTGAALDDLIAAELNSNPALDLTSDSCGDGAGRRTASSTATGLDCVEAPRAPRAILLSDLARSLDDADRPVAAAVLAALDDRGFLDEPSHVLAVRLGVTRRRVNRALAAIRSLTSPGVGAGGIREHLVLEVRAVDADPHLRRLAERIVADHLELLAADDLRALADVLDQPVRTVRAACALVRERVRPWPAIDLAPAAIGSQDRAEIAIERHGATLAVRVLEAERWTLRVHPGLRRAVEHAGDTTPNLPAAVAAAVDRAVRFVDRVEQRWRTMRLVADAVVVHQRDFVLDGPRALVPLTRARIAAQVGIHESTVSRAVRDRHVVLPDRRVVPFAAFFDAARATREVLRDLIAAEQTPLSDAELVDALASHGHRVARRTVVKYRRQLGIANSRQRVRTRSQVRAS